MPLKKFYAMTVIMLIFSFTFATVYDIINKDELNIGFFFLNLNDLQNLESDENDFIAYLLDLEEIDSELCYLALGATRNYNLIQDFAREIGYYLKSLGVDIVIFGNLKLLDKNVKDDPTHYIGNSPYLVAEVMYRMIRGFETSGVVPVVIVTSDDNKNITDSLLQKVGSFYSYSSELKKVDLFFNGDCLKFTNDNIFKIPWTYGSENLEEIIQQLYKSSIVLSGYRNEGLNLLYKEINYTDKKAVTYFSKSVEEDAKKVFEGELLPTGNKNW
ncbi:MAG TPA: hypothetical protein PK894_06225 [Defluviitoga sp.]|nr:hypothetical protein [Defluviitoga sp.]HOP24908.1 hypothetical protein [Defluviitoga sp.]HPU59959.1 hypothetical protein [Defluviitoga tunisiensis]HPZ29217.1 hypothetical protein [Defluviitoga sp.]HQD63172.1 hypothetical protein [Defluviitoga sp.]